MMNYIEWLKMVEKKLWACNDEATFIEKNPQIFFNKEEQKAALTELGKEVQFLALAYDAMKEKHNPASLEDSPKLFYPLAGNREKVAQFKNN